MKKIFLVIVMVISCYLLHAQDDPATYIGKRIADKMKDTLLLTELQRDKIYSLNLELNEEKMKIRRQSPGRDLLTVLIQKVENRRDSLYRLILDEKQYGLYKQKKGSLVSNN